MKSYSGFERAVAKALESFPAARNGIKTLYHRFNYIKYGERNFRNALHPHVTLSTLEQWTGIPTVEGEIFFGYYDKTPWSSPSMGKYISHRIIDNNLSEILVFCNKDKNMSTIANSRTWNCQQGAMAQWIPRSGEDKLIFNDFIDGQLGCRVLALDSSELLNLPWPVQAVNPNGKRFLSLNYRRLARLRPEYGYFLDVSNFSPDQPYETDGIWDVEFTSRKAVLIISIQKLESISPSHTMNGSRHKVNHLLYSPDGKQFVFMHRWIGSQGKWSRLYLADSDGSNLRILLDDRMVSHYSWRDDSHLLAWARTKEQGDHYYLINVENGERTIIGEGTLDVYGDGHPSYSPCKRFIVTDSYPDKARQRHLLLYDTFSSKVTEIGRFLAPWKFDGLNRCDLHPRWSPDGQWLSIDSAHDGVRRSYLLNISRIMGG